MCLWAFNICATIPDKGKRYKDDRKLKNGLSDFKNERDAAGCATGGNNGNTLGGTAPYSDVTVHTNGEEQQVIKILRQGKVVDGIELEFGDILIAPMSKSIMMQIKVLLVLIN